MIELRNLTKSYLLASGERRYVFRDLNFSFPDGANIGLLGPNGAGKSTLLKLIGGIDMPDRGEVVTDKRMSWPVGQASGLPRSLTGRDWVKFLCRVYGAEGPEMREKVRFVQDFSEIGEYFNQPVKSYSPGMRARLNFGMSMAFDFDYYLMDEIMAVGDARFKRKSKEALLEKLSRANVIFISHAMEEIKRLCDRVVLVHDGQAELFEDVGEGIQAYQEFAGFDPRLVRRGRRLRRLARLAAKEAEAGADATAGEAAADSGGPAVDAAPVAKIESPGIG